MSDNGSNIESIFYSSLKYQKTFEGLNKDQIIDRYEHILATREKQMRDIANEVGDLNERLNEVNSLFIYINKYISHSNNVENYNRKTTC